MSSRFDSNYWLNKGIIKITNKITNLDDIFPPRLYISAVLLFAGWTKNAAIQFLFFSTGKHQRAFATSLRTIPAKDSQQEKEIRNRVYRAPDLP